MIRLRASVRSLALLAACAAAGAAPLAAQPALTVPAATTPTLVDGQLTPGEWEGAASLPLANGMRLLAKQMRGHVWLAIATGTRVPHPVDIYLAEADGAIRQLHASAQIGERRAADTLWADRGPAWHWGNHEGWMANEAKEDDRRERGLPFAQRLFPADATEFHLLRERFPGAEWRVRIDVGAFPGSTGALTHPAGATRDPATWMVLRLE